MHGLKRVDWVMGQPLLPHHLIAMEDSLIAHACAYRRGLGLPMHGISHLKWDPVLLGQGVVSIDTLAATFSSGHHINIPDNARIDSFDLGRVGESKVVLYLHLLGRGSAVSESLDSNHEPINLSIHELLLAIEPGLAESVSTLKIGEFVKSLEGNWGFVETMPPLLTDTFSTPFLLPFLSRLRSLIANYQARLITGNKPGGSVQTYTMKTRLCLAEVAKLRRFLINQERGINVHPFYLYQQLCEFIDVVALIDNDEKDLQLIAYQHDGIGILFDQLHKILSDLLNITTSSIASVTFEQEGNTYVIEKIPAALKEAEEIFLVIEAPEKQIQAVDGVKLASLSRLPSVVRYALGGISLVRRESAPFDNSFVKEAHVYALQRDSEWEFAVREGDLGLMCQSGNTGLRCGVYWR